MRSFAIDEILLTLFVTLVPYETSEMFHQYHPYFHKYFYIFLFGGCCSMEPGNYCSWNARRHLANAGTFRDVWFCVIPWKLLICCLCLKQNIAKGTTEDWVLVTKVTSFGHITSSQTILSWFWLVYMPRIKGKPAKKRKEILGTFRNKNVTLWSTKIHDLI